MVSALNKYWRPITTEEYLKKMDIPSTNEAIQVACFPKEISDWIWEEEKQVGAHFTKVSKVV